MSEDDELYLAADVLALDAALFQMLKIMHRDHPADVDVWLRGARLRLQHRQPKGAPALAQTAIRLADQSLVALFEEATGRQPPAEE